MKTKRTLGEALHAAELDADARAFLQGGPESALASVTPAVPATATLVMEIPATVPLTTSTEVAKALPADPPPTLPPTALVSATVSMTFRLPAEMAAALLQVSSERRLRKAEPFTQQGIVTDAVWAWLARQGWGKV